MPENRPNPDELLAQIKGDDDGPRRGNLKIFFGYAAGVGKTFAMLEAARQARAAGLDVVVGFVQPHGRLDTESLLEGFEQIPTRSTAYKGVTLQEFDLDAALRRRPQLILVDELAHTNVEGSRHIKRWQDVEELLAAGIDVYSTLNVQHVESLNDVIAQITGVVVRETLSDSVVERADDFELIDLTPDELIARLKAGKVYVQPQAERAVRHFFQKTNLTALRELSLRQVAQRLNKDVEAARSEKSAQAPWATNERLLVCVGPSPTSAKLIRTAKRMATAFNAQWLAVAVESPATVRPEMSQRVTQHLRLAERLGAETQTLVGDDVSRTLIDFATSRNVTKIVVGKTNQPRWRRFIFGSLVDLLLERSGDIDVYVIRGEPEELRPAQTQHPAITVRWDGYLAAAAVVLTCGLIGWLSHVHELTEANIVMLFLLGVAIVATQFGRGPAVAAAIASVLAFDFFFVPPRLTFSVSDAQYVVTFAVMLIIGLIISALTARMKEQLQSAQSRQRRTDALFRLTRQLTEVSGSEFLIRSAGQQVQTIFDGTAVVYVKQAGGPMTVRFGEESAVAKLESNLAVATWVADHQQIAGLGTDTLPNATAIFVPLVGSRRTIGALAVRSADAVRFSDPEQIRLLETCASLIALSLERDQSVLEAAEAEMRVQTEEMKNSLLSSVSHDLRTPLAVIAAGSSSLLNDGGDPKSRRETLQTLVQESHRLTRLVENLLDITRLESGAVEPNKEWHVLEEIVGSALKRTREFLPKHPVTVHIPLDFPLLFLDGVLFEQAFVNMLENAARYTPPGTKIDIRAETSGREVHIRISDNGPGLPSGHEAKVLEKFQRGASKSPDGRRGVGLGLAICRAIAEVHGGQLKARNRADGGAEFIFALPAKRSPPHVEIDEPIGSAVLS